MPEGPSIVVLKEAIDSFRGKKILEADGYGKGIDYGRLHGTKIKRFASPVSNFINPQYDG